MLLALHSFKPHNCLSMHNSTDAFKNMSGISSSIFSSVVNSLAMLFQPVLPSSSKLSCEKATLVNFSHYPMLKKWFTVMIPKSINHRFFLKIYQLYLISTHPFSPQSRSWLIFLLKQTPASFLSAQHWNDSHFVKALGISLFCWSVWAASHLLFWEGQHSFRNSGGGCWCMLLNED